MREFHRRIISTGAARFSRFGVLLPILFLWSCSTIALPEAQNPATNDTMPAGRNAMQVYYLEIVTPEVEKTCEALAAQHDVTFSAPEPALGNARTAEMLGGGRIAVRAPMRDTEDPVVRPYLLVDDIEAATTAAEAAGAEFAMRATEIPGQGKFAIYFIGGIQHGIWEAE